MEQPVVKRPRIESIDILRGIVMVIMALDHVRDFFHSEAMKTNPLDPATTYAALYFTRWITHFCAPIFVFLAGTSAYLSGRRRSGTQLASFLVKRGLWLILVEITLVTFGLTFNPFFNMIILQVIWAIGISFVFLGFCVRLPWKIILSIGLIIVFGHNILDTFEAAKGRQFGFIWDILHGRAFSLYPLGKNHVLVILYAFLPWTGVMFLGYCFGSLFDQNVESKKRRRIMLITGSCLWLLFFVVRYINIYGDPFPWSVQQTAGRTILSFLNLNKYPPSMLYMCVMIGGGILALAFLEKTRNRFLSVMKVYGNVPFFYYIIHFYVIHLLVVICFLASGSPASDINTPGSPFLFRPVSFGYPLWIVYLIWFAVVAFMYPLCRWYQRYKSSHDHWWLSYL